MGFSEEQRIRKVTYVRTRGVWKVYWMRADCKWHGYQPNPEMRHLGNFLRIVDEDKWCCFWG
jgi:hypothetical protein